jgi:hypothetical protein
MLDTEIATRPGPDAAPDLAFTPVPRLCDRSNGWKPEVQRRFIDALAETGSVVAACRRVGRSDNSAYQLRRHPEAGEFRAAWDAAADLGVRRIEDAAMDRALYGVEETYYHRGELVGRCRRYNERLVMFILRNRAPHRFADESRGDRALNAVEKMRLERLKQAWRREWAAELAAKERSPDEVRASIIAKLEAFEAHECQNWTPREHELRAALDAERAQRKAREQQEARERFAQLNPGRPWHPPAADDAPVLDDEPLAHDADDHS